MFESLWSTVSMVVYAIWGPDFEKVYVGKTTGTLKNRLAAHLHGARTGKGHCRYIARAIRKYGPENMRVHVIDGAETEEELNRKEVFWIKELRANDRQYGYNLTDGGEGNSGWVPTEETRQKMGVGSRVGQAQMSEKAKRSWRASNGAAQRIAQNRPDVKARMSTSAKVAWTYPEVRARRKTVMARLDVRVRVSTGVKAHWAREEAAGRVLQPPEVRERNRLSMQKWRARKRAEKEGVPA